MDPSRDGSHGLGGGILAVDPVEFRDRWEGEGGKADAVVPGTALPPSAETTQSNRRAGAEEELRLGHVGFGGLVGFRQRADWQIVGNGRL